MSLYNIMMSYTLITVAHFLTDKCKSHTSSAARTQYVHFLALCIKLETFLLHSVGLEYYKTFGPLNKSSVNVGM